jgi:hypothetical protein
MNDDKNKIDWLSEGKNKNKNILQVLTTFKEK